MILNSHGDTRLSATSPIRAWRELLNFTLTTVVKRTRIDRDRLIALEAGEGYPRPAELDALSLALGVTPEKLSCADQVVAPKPTVRSGGLAPDTSS